MEITKTAYEELVQGEKPIVLDFWATWCGPCRKIAPDVEALAAQYADQAVIGKVNVEEEDELAARFGIRNIPTLLFIKGGQVVDKCVGAVPRSTIESKIQTLIG